MCSVIAGSIKQEAGTCFCEYTYELSDNIAAWTSTCFCECTYELSGNTAAWTTNKQQQESSRHPCLSATAAAPWMKTLYLKTQDSQCSAQSVCKKPTNIGH